MSNLLEMLLPSRFFGVILFELEIEFTSFRYAGTGRGKISSTLDAVERKWKCICQTSHKKFLLVELMVHGSMHIRSFKIKFAWVLAYKCP